MNRGYFKAWSPLRPFFMAPLIQTDPLPLLRVPVADRQREGGGRRTATEVAGGHGEILGARCRDVHYPRDTPGIRRSTLCPAPPFLKRPIDGDQSLPLADMA